MKKIFLVFTGAVFLLSFSVAQAVDFNAAEVYTTSCHGCHGLDGTLAPSDGVKSFNGKSSAEVQTMLQGYKDGTYGGADKMVMTGLAKNFSEEQLKALADYCANL